MLKLLLKKDLLLFKRDFLTRKKKNITNLVWSTILFGLILTILVYVFFQTMIRADYYDFSYELYTLGLEVLIITLAIFAVPKTAKKLYASSEQELMTLLPLDMKTLTVAKLINISLIQLVNFSIVYLPFYISFGLVQATSFAYWILGVLMIVPATVFLVFISLILSYPYLFLKIKLHDHKAAKFIIAIGLAIVFSFLYKMFLDFFVGLIQDDRLGYLFNYDTIHILHQISLFMIPANSITDILRGQGLAYSIPVILVLTGGSVFISYFVFRVYYRKSRHINLICRQYKSNNNKLKLTNNLFKKEWILITRDFDTLLTRFVLLIAVIFLLAAILSALNTLIFRSIGQNEGVSTLAVFGIISLFYCLINSFSSLIGGRDNIELIKQLPLSYRRQLNVKLFIAFATTFISLTVTVFSLHFLGIIAIGPMFVIWGSVSFLNLFLLVYSLIYETKHLSSIRDVVNNNNIIFMSILIPLLTVIIGIVGFIVGQTMFMNLLLLCFSGILALGAFYYYYSRIEKIFAGLEVK